MGHSLNMNFRWILSTGKTISKTLREQKDRYTFTSKAEVDAIATQNSDRLAMKTGLPARRVQLLMSLPEMVTPSQTLTNMRLKKKGVRHKSTFGLMTYGWLGAQAFQESMGVITPGTSRLCFRIPVEQECTHREARNGSLYVLLREKLSRIDSDAAECSDEVTAALVHPAVGPHTDMLDRIQLNILERRNITPSILLQMRDGGRLPETTPRASSCSRRISSSAHPTPRPPAFSRGAISDWPERRTSDTRRRCLGTRSTRRGSSRSSV